MTSQAQLPKVAVHGTGIQRSPAAAITTRGCRCCTPRCRPLKGHVRLLEVRLKRRVGLECSGNARV